MTLPALFCSVELPPSLFIPSFPAEKVFCVFPDGGIVTNFCWLLEDLVGKVALLSCWSECFIGGASAGRLGLEARLSPTGAAERCSVGILSLTVPASKALSEESVKCRLGACYLGGT